MWWPDEGCHTGNPVASNGGVPPASRLRRQNIPQPALPMIGRMIRASGADDVAPLGSQFRKLRFKMIADTRPEDDAQERVEVD